MTSVLDKIKLTNEEESALMSGERQLLEVLPILDQLDACGADCAERRQRVAQLLGILQELRKQFGTIPVESE